MIKVSIIVPVYDSPEFIEPFFKFFHRNPLPNTIELILIDNGSSRVFYNELVIQGESIANCNVYRYCEKQSSYAARNYGVSQSKGQILAFTDFDCILSKSYIDLLLNIKINPNNIISGRVDLFYSKHNIFELFDKYAYLNQNTYSKAKKGATANLLVPRNIFETLNGFSEFISGGDGEFCQRVQRSGFGFEYNSDLVISHPTRNTLKEHEVKAKRLGIGASQNMLKRRFDISRKLFLITKNLIGIIIPFHQIRIGFKILFNPLFSRKDIFKLIHLCYKIGFLQRVEIVKTAWKK